MNVHIPASTLALCLLSFTLCGKSVPFFDHGKTGWSVHIAPDAPAPVAFAATELTNFLKRASGADFPVVADGAAPENGIVIGEPQSSSEIRWRFSDLATNGNDRIVIQLDDGRLYIAGDKPRSALYAVYRFLDRELDIRFLWPGEDGEFVPKAESHTLGEVDHTHANPFPYRVGTALCGNPYHKPTHRWLARNYVNMAPLPEDAMLQTGFIRQMHGGHSVFIESEKDFAEHPEYFALVQGQRNRKIGIAGCWSNPGFLKLMAERHIDRLKNCDIATLFPADATVRCECPDCTENPDPSSRWYAFYGKLMAELRKTHPDLTFAAIGYQEYAAVPKDPPPPLEYVAYCQYDRCYSHKLADTNCTVNVKSLARIKEWQKKAPMGVYGYHFDIYRNPTAYLPFWNMLADEVKTYKTMGLRYVMTEMAVEWPEGSAREDIIPLQHRLSLYLYNQLAWDPDADVDALLIKFCQSAYGPAWEEVHAYHSAMASAWDALKIHIVYFFNKPTATARHYITPALVAEAKTHLNAADAILAGCPTGAETARYQREVALERALLAQWEKHARLANEDLTMIPLGKAQGGDLFAGAKKHPMMSHAKATQSAFVQFARSRDALHVRVNAVRDMAALKKGVAGHDGSAVWADCDYVEIFFDPGDAAGYRHLMVNPAGGHYDAQGMDTSWNPFWSHGVKLLEDRWVLDVSIPFSNFEKPVADGDEWPVVVDFCRLADDDGPNQFGFPAPMFHDVSGGAVLHFSPAVETAGKDVLWYGAEKSNTEWFAPGLLEDGWSFTSAAAGTNAIGTQPEDFTLIVMYTYNGNQIPQSFWNEHLVPAVTNGATIVFNTFGTMIPLEQWFSNPDLRVAIDSQKNDIQDRQVYFEKTSFATMPNDMAKCSSFLEELPTFTPTNKARWTVLAEIKKADGSKAPILMAAKVGRGMVVLSHPIRSGRSPLSVARFLSNVLAWGIAQSPR